MSDDEETPHAVRVAQHYNAVQEKGIQDRSKSRIFHLRSLNNWVKSMLIGDFLRRIKSEKGSEQDVTVLDLCCGKGGDLQKWKMGQISKLICADIAEVSLEQCQNRYNEMVKRMEAETRNRSKPFSCEFIHADCTKVHLREKYTDPNTSFDLVSCQFSLHYAFESLSMAKRILDNVCDNLRPGGYFIGAIPDANRILHYFRKSKGNEYANDIVKMEYDGDPFAQPPLFGAKYDFQLDELVNLPEYLVHFPLLAKMLKDRHLDLVYYKTFPDFIEQHRHSYDGKQLLHRMQALEPYPPEGDVKLMGSEEKHEYDYARNRLQEMINEGREQRDGRSVRIGTISMPEWEVSCLYMTFAFKKKGQLPRNPESRKRKREYDDSDSE